MSDSDWEEIIHEARNSNGESGRKILKMASFRLRDNIQLPKSLRGYLADVLGAAADASTSPSQPNFIGNALNVTLPIGTTPRNKKFQDAIEADSYREDAYKQAEREGLDKQATHVKLAAKKLGISKKTALRRIQYYEGMLRSMHMELGRFNDP